MALTLEKPSIHLYKALMQVDKDFEAAGEEPYCGVHSQAGFWLWLWTVREQAKTEAIELGSNPNEIYFLVDEEGRVCACGQFRPVSTQDVLTWAGHIGYSVPPSLRGRGYAQTILRLLLRMAYERGLTRVLLTCDETNAPSRHVIEKAGGDYCGNYRERGYNKRQYWFYKQRRGGGLEET